MSRSVCRRGHVRRLACMLAIGLAVTLVGCAGRGIERRAGATPPRPFSPAQLAKSEVDQISELTQREVLLGLQRLAVKLYKRNPGEYRKSGTDDAEAAGRRLFEDLPRWQTAAPGRPDWQAGLRSAFDEAYAGDRVQAYIGSLLTMIMSAYNHRTEFYLTDSLDAQRLYNSARNIEVAAWKLAQARFPGDRRVLLSNSLEGEVQNLSFEREIGKLIAHQDLLALIMEERTQRTVTRVLQNVAAFVFIPL